MKKQEMFAKPKVSVRMRRKSWRKTTGSSVKASFKRYTRETALEIIRVEYAKYGKETRESMRAYVENRISAEARNEAVKRGLKIFERGR